MKFGFPRSKGAIFVMAKPVDIRKIKDLIPFIPIGTSIFLRKDAIPEAKIKEFTFQGVGNEGKICLEHDSGEYVWEAEIDLIDWERFLKENPHLTDSFSSRKG